MGQVIEMREVKNTWNYISKVQKQDAIAQEIYVARSKLHQMKAIYLTNNEVDRWKSYVEKWERRYKIKYIEDESLDAFTKRYRGEPNETTEQRAERTFAEMWEATKALKLLCDAA